MRELTYPEVGATAGDLPAFYHHLRRSAVIGHGAEDFRRAGDALFAWEVQRRSGLRVRAASHVAVGADVEVAFGVGPFRIPAPCRVISVEDTDTRRGFAYGTLRGHPESGEESFTVVLRPDGAVELEIVAFSKPGRWFTRLGAPIGRKVQSRVTNRYLKALSTLSR